MAFIRVLYKYANVNTLEESIRRLDRYSRPDGGTWRVSRESCSLPFEPPTVNPDVIDTKATLIQRITELGDDLASVAISNNAEVIKTPSSLGSIWKRLSPPNPAGAPKKEGVGVSNFEMMIKESIWTQRGQTQKGYAVYFHVLRCGGSMRKYIRIWAMESIRFSQKWRISRRSRDMTRAMRGGGNSTILRDYGRA